MDAKMIDNYNALPLGTYLDIDAVLQDDTLDDLDKQVRIIAILSDQAEADILALPLPDYAALARKTDFLRHECPPVTAPARVIVGERVYVPVQDFTKICTAQYVDFQTFSKAGTPKLPELLAVLLVPEGKTYNEGYDFAQVAEDVRTLPLPVALSLVGFFFASLSGSILASLTSLDSLIAKVPKTQREALQKTATSLRESLAGLGLQM